MARKPKSVIRKHPLLRHAKTPQQRKALESMVWRASPAGKKSKARASRRKSVITAVRDKRNAQKYAITQDHPAVKSFWKNWDSLYVADRKKVAKAAPGKVPGMRKFKK